MLNYYSKFYQICTQGWSPFTVCYVSKQRGSGIQPNRLVGWKLTIYSDHKPLENLFGRSRLVHTLASARIQQWALTLGAYDYDINYKPGKDQASTDFLSRLSLSEAPNIAPIPAISEGQCWSDSCIVRKF